MTEPTDAEIVALADATRTAEGGANGYILPISFCRAVLAKWGTPPAVAGEPVAWLNPWRADQVTTDYDAYGELYTAPQPLPTSPTQAQAGAVPLTDEQWQRIADLTDSILTRATKDEIERVIGIKGRQHGNE